VVDIVDLNEALYASAGPGHWKDPDMLQVGNGGMTGIEGQAHFSLSAIMAAPLMAGNDIANMDGRVMAPWSTKRCLPSTRFSVTVAPHGTAMVRVTP
jgi:hypothetical protein